MGTAVETLWQISDTELVESIAAHETQMRQHYSQTLDTLAEPDGRAAAVKLGHSNTSNTVALLVHALRISRPEANHRLAHIAKAVVSVIGSSTGASGKSSSSTTSRTSPHRPMWIPRGNREAAAYATDPGWPGPEIPVPGLPDAKMDTLREHPGVSVTEPTRPTFLRRKLGAKLRRMREEAGFTLDTAAPRLDRKRSALHRVETGETKADVHLVKSMMDLYDRYEEGLLEEVREALKPPWYRAYGSRHLGYVDVETAAAQLYQYLAINIPGLLQTEAYMRAVFSNGYSRSVQEMENDVAVRLIRQQRLTDEERPLELVAIVYEGALHRKFGGPEVMREQLRHLIEMSALPTVTLHVVPLDEASLDLPAGAFNLLMFPDPEDQPLLYVEHPTGSLHIENPQQVANAILLVEQLQTGALNTTDSVALIERLATEL